MSKPVKANRNAPILITMGEPAGVGPEIAWSAWSSLGGAIGGRPIRFVGDPFVFAHAPKACVIASHALATPPTPGHPDPANTHAIVDAVDTAVALAMDGAAAAVVTAPVQKESLIHGGFEYAGHTEYLARITGADRAVMMLVGGGLRVVPLTIHVPIKDVAERITAPLIVETGEIVLRALKRDFGLPKPRLAVSGLNPHAGEGGAVGTEEREHILPAINSLRANGASVSGPLPADTMFHEAARARYDAALCMYHDQALIPLKTLAFWDGVNVTLGLPIVRTSPDHGTALDIAGRGKADAASMIAAIRLAADMADARSR